MGFGGNNNLVAARGCWGGMWLIPCDLSCDLIGQPTGHVTGHVGLATPTNKRRDTTRWHKGGVDHIQFCLIIQCHVMHVTPLMTK